jgi:hypothetical protein
LKDLINGWCFGLIVGIGNVLREMFDDLQQNKSFKVSS